MNHSPIIIALDFPQKEPALTCAKQLSPQHCRLKIGSELFTREGAPLIAQLRELGFEIFLDLKFHDIPNTVAAAVRVASDLGVWMVNVHASGGLAMMQAAKEAATAAKQAPLLTAVTVLTSFDDAALGSVGVDDLMESQVRRLARLAFTAGLDGVVCSAAEVPVIKKSTAPQFLTVTPGIRPQQSAHDDQKRVFTLKEALAQGSDYLVIGRPITRAADPAQALNAIMATL